MDSAAGLRSVRSQVTDNDALELCRGNTAVLLETALSVALVEKRIRHADLIGDVTNHFVERLARHLLNKQHEAHEAHIRIHVCLTGFVKQLVGKNSLNARLIGREGRHVEQRRRRSRKPARMREKLEHSDVLLAIDTKVGEMVRHSAVEGEEALVNASQDRDRGVHLGQTGRIVYCVHRRIFLLAVGQLDALSAIDTGPETALAKGEVTDDDAVSRNESDAAWLDGEHLVAGCVAPIPRLGEGCEVGDHVLEGFGE